MLCFRYKRLLIPYSEGELDERARRKLEAHLGDCERCSSDLRAIRSVSGAFAASGTPAVEPAGDLWARVSERIAVGPPRTAPKPWFCSTQALSAAATAAVVLVFGFVLIRSDILTRPEPVQPNAPAISVEQPKGDLRQGDALASAKRRPAQPDMAGPLTKGKMASTALPPEVKSPRVSGGAPRVEHYARPTVPPHRAVAMIPAPSSETRVRETDSWVGYSGGHRSYDYSERDESKRDRSSALDDAVSTAAPAAAPVPGPAPLVGEAGVTASVAAAPVAMGSLYRIAAAERGAEQPADESVVDALNETEGVRTAALFAYP